jgi:hypothetical protein
MRREFGANAELASGAATSVRHRDLGPIGEIGFGDGTTRRVGPGDARLVEDTTGQGHTTRYVGPGPVITATIPLA